MLYRQLVGHRARHRGLVLRRSKLPFAGGIGAEVRIGQRDRKVIGHGGCGHLRRTGRSIVAPHAQRAAKSMCRTAGNRLDLDRRVALLRRSRPQFRVDLTPFPHYSWR